MAEETTTPQSHMRDTSQIMASINNISRKETSMSDNKRDIEAERVLGALMGNMPELIEVMSTGRYVEPWLKSYVGEGNYTKKHHAIVLRDELGNQVESEQQALMRITRVLADPALSYAYANEEKVVTVHIHSMPGWRTFEKILGVNIINSPKVAKRLTITTRLGYMHVQLAANECLDCHIPGIKDMASHKHAPIVFQELTSEEYTDIPRRDLKRWIKRENKDLLERMTKRDAIAWVNAEVDTFLARVGDGWDIISTELRDVCAHHGRRYMMTLGLDMEEIAEVDKKVTNAPSYQFRGTWSKGHIKGECYAVPRKYLGFDVGYHPENNKKELKSDDVFILLEPIHGHGNVWIDDQTDTWLGEFLYPLEERKQWMLDMNTSMIRQLREGKPPRFFSDVNLLKDDGITQFQRQALIWKDAGFDIKESIFLTERIGQGHLNMLRRKRRWPVAMAWYSHVITEWALAAGGTCLNCLEPGAAGHECEKPPMSRGTIRYDEHTGRMVYTDWDFMVAYLRHGGWDGDDACKYHLRRAIWKIPFFYGITLEMELPFWVIVRSPNAYGEYDIKMYYPGSPIPTWEKEDGTVIDSVYKAPMVDLAKAPLFIEDLDQVITKVPGSADPIDPDYTPAVVLKAWKAAYSSIGVFGRWANAQMVYYFTTGTYRPITPAVEDVIDACTQELSVEAMAFIEGDIEATLSEIISARMPIDKILWAERIGQEHVDGIYRRLGWAKQRMIQESLTDLYEKQMYEVAQEAIKHVDIPWIVNLSNGWEKTANMLYEAFFNLLPEGVNVRDKFLQVNDIMVAFLTGKTTELQLPNAVLHRGEMKDNDVHDILLAMYARALTTVRPGKDRKPVHKDVPVFQGAGMECTCGHATYEHEKACLVDSCTCEKFKGAGFRTGMMDLLIAALQFYGYKNPGWKAEATCTVCGTVKELRDPVNYQKYLANPVCKECREQ